ncbi:helitron helicase-like domain-containing protein [Artemisia annua]|uniref:Helitron helicase-like domain-containing protein n=1 Tax=Artemisia annua TaxID=35608 RepID=A0A2U1LR38_ARTAN|nr:helitron helicase-like domain-containing protein [Artemisia annua]
MEISQSLCSYEVSTSTSVNDLGVRHVGDHGTVSVSIAGVSTGIESNVATSPSFCGSDAGSSSRDISTMEIGEKGGGYGVVNAAQNLHLNEGHLLVPSLPCELDLPDGVPVQVPTVDGSVSTFQVTNIVRPFYVAARQPAITEVYNTGGAGHVPMVLDFSAGDVVRGPNLGAPQLNNHMNASKTGIPARSRRQAGQPYMRYPDAPPVQGPIAPPQREDVIKYVNIVALFWLEEKRTGLPISAAPQYQRCCAAGRAVLRTHEQYPPYITQLFSDRHFMENIRAYNQMFLYIYDTEHEVQNRLSHFETHERRALRESIIEGLVDFLDHNNALVRLFRTARDKLREADIPNFSIRLFGVVGASQYELPTADSIGAIVYEGGPETMTDYDVVIERHSGQPESVNKLHPAYM